MGELGEAVRERRGPVLQHSVRSAVYQHLDSSGERLFRREQRPKGRGRYFAR
jgi:hypothetical protein